MTKLWKEQEREREEREREKKKKKVDVRNEGRCKNERREVTYVPLLRGQNLTLLRFIHSFMFLVPNSSLVKISVRGMAIETKVAGAFFSLSTESLG
jgi:hypothetical protein